MWKNAKFFHAPKRSSFLYKNVDVFCYKLGEDGLGLETT